LLTRQLDQNLILDFTQATSHSGTKALQLGSNIYFEAPALPASCQTNCTVLL
jgi:hypothetical protein